MYSSALRRSRGRPSRPSNVAEGRISCLLRYAERSANCRKLLSRESSPNGKSTIVPAMSAGSLLISSRLGAVRWSSQMTINPFAGQALPPALSSVAFASNLAQACLKTSPSRLALSATIRIGLMRKAELSFQPLSHRHGRSSSLVPIGVMDQQSAEDEMGAGSRFRTGVATLIHIEEMHAVSQGRFRSRAMSSNGGRFLGGLLGREVGVPLRGVLFIG